MEKNLNSIGTLIKLSETGSTSVSNYKESERQVLSENVDPERLRLEKSCLAAATGQSIGAMMRATEIETGTALHLEIKYCAVTYCGAPNTDPEVIKEAVRFVVTKYTHLALPEIREAFRLTAAGKIGANLNAYNGLFTIRMLGEVLTSYDDHRNQVAREVRARLSEKEAEEEDQIKAGILIEKFGTLAQQYGALVKKNTKYQRWQDLPEWFCNRLVKEDIPGFTLEEKGRTWVTAKHWAVNQVDTWLASRNTHKDDKRRYQRAKTHINNRPDEFPEELKKEAQTAYIKMLVFDRLPQIEQP